MADVSYSVHGGPPWYIRHAHSVLAPWAPFVAVAASLEVNVRALKTKGRMSAALSLRRSCSSRSVWQSAAEGTGLATRAKPWIDSWDRSR
jgi:hypothetical protein